MANRVRTRNGSDTGSHGGTRGKQRDTSTGTLTTEILLDNAANISILNPRLLKSVRPAEKKIRVKGVGDVQMVVEHVGDLEGFLRCMLAVRLGLTY
jgi:hypothetical protein